MIIKTEDEVREIYNLKHIIITSLDIFTIISQKLQGQPLQACKIHFCWKPRKYVEEILKDVLNGIMKDE